MSTTPVSGNQMITQVQPPTTRGFTDLDSEDFFGLLIAQLQNQDPLKPTDNQQLLQQMSSIRQMEQSTTLNKTLTSLAGEQRFGATAGLIGHYVSGTVKDSGGNSVEVQGVVTGVQFDRTGNALLELHNGKRIPAGSVDLVTLVENLPPDLLAQIQAETAAAGTSTGTASKAVAPAPGDFLRNIGKQTQSAASIIDELFSPSASVGI